MWPYTRISDSNRLTTLPCRASVAFARLITYAKLHGTSETECRFILYKAENEETNTCKFSMKAFLFASSFLFFAFKHRIGKEYSSKQKYLGTDNYCSFFIPMFKDRNRMGAVCWRESAGRFHFRAGCAVKKRWLRCSLSRHVHLSKQGAGAGVSGGHWPRSIKWRQTFAVSGESRRTWDENIPM